MVFREAISGQIVGAKRDDLKITTAGKVFRINICQINHVFQLTDSRSEPAPEYKVHFSLMEGVYVQSITLITIFVESIREIPSV